MDNNGNNDENSNKNNNAPNQSDGIGQKLGFFAIAIVVLVIAKYVIGF
ncbi:MAG TPA: hypothetical protein PLM07_05920 [Candidatus Rifleibacterium sp.]|nr:hypothetical protein [Candidatus Rifleibacterium sp.]HPT45417.1 hypothetical protein [Candidatus Rifleibacterium sp.]